jgi:hypothetical protein
MRVSLLMAGGLTTFVAVAHSYLGERYILRRLFRRTGLPKLFGGEEFTSGRCASPGTSRASPGWGSRS